MATLRAIIELEELKKDTDTTKKVLLSAKRVLASYEAGEERVTQLLTAMNEKFSSMIDSVQHYRSTVTRRDKLWVLFHRFTTEDGRTLCDRCDKDMGLTAPDMFWQLLMEKEFIAIVTKQQASQSGVSTSSPRKLTYIEENAVRYTAGYIIRKLEGKYSRIKTEEAAECCTALQEMGGKVKSKVPSEHQSCDWTKLTDRGGLYHVEDLVYELFVTIELIVDKELSTIFSTKGEGLEKVKKDKLSWVCNDEDVQFLWCMISPATIEEERVRQQLLQDIVHLWITTRGHSKARRVKEDYKREKGKSVKGKHSLRKELAVSVESKD